MSPFPAAVVLMLSVLFIVLSLIPLMSDIGDMDTSRKSQRPKSKAAR